MSSGHDNSDISISSDKDIAASEPSTMYVMCPDCNAQTMSHTVIELEMPYFGKCISTTLICERCGRKSSDLFAVEMHEPLVYEMTIVSSDDMSVRVARSNSCTIEIPELGLKVEPASGSIAYISNVEGVLLRFSHAVETAVIGGDDEVASSKAAKLLERIDSIREGDETATLVLYDPYGNSIIDSKKAQVRSMTEAEIASFKTGVQVYDKSEISGGTKYETK